MKWVRFVWSLSIVAIALPTEAVLALPGQTIEEATAWVRSHPTLKPAPGERLLIRKSDTPAKRFTFQALPLPVGRLAPGLGIRIIRSEELALVDLVNGVSRDRLLESLRLIYGASVYQDYQQAKIAYSYANGELREGEFYGYWLETFPKPGSVADAGRVTVFLKADLPKLEAELKANGE